MQNTHHFLVTLAAVFGVAGVTTILFNKLRQPVVLGYIAAGLLVGPNLPFFPITADVTLIEELSELGVILLMFALGLEFKLGNLLKVGPTALLTTLFEASLMLWLGYLTGRAFGWTTMESFFLGAIVSISSTTIVARAFEDVKMQNPVRGVVIGVLLVEDLVAIVLMTVLTAVAAGRNVSAGEFAMTIGRLVAFLAAMLVAGLLIVPRLMKLVFKQQSQEMLAVASIAICFGFALLANAANYSVALGAFIAGSLIAETGRGHEVEQAIRPIRDIFAAVFFVSVGMLLDPRLLLDWWPHVLAVAAVVIIGKMMGVSLGVFFTGNGVKTAVQSGLSLAQIGEFSFIIATLGLSLKATRPFLYPIAVAVSALTTLTTPAFIRAAPKIAAKVEGALPARVQTWVALYTSWFERMRGASKDNRERSPIARLVKLLLVDVAVILATVLTVALLFRTFDDSMRWARWGLLALGAAVLAGVGGGLARVLRTLGDTLAERALPSVGRVDLARAPRRALSALLRVVVGVLVMGPALAVLIPFLKAAWIGAIAVALLLVLLGTFARSAADFEGHLRAGAQVVAAALSAPAPKEKAEKDTLHQVRTQLPGLGEPVPCEVPAGSPVLGKTLAQINLRGLTGATVLAIHRSNDDVLLPSAGEMLHAGDVLALAGSTEAVTAAQQLLRGEA